MAIIKGPPGSEAAEALFYEWVGRCVKQWALVERELFDLCFLTMHPKHEAAAVVFWRQPNIEVRLSLVTDLLKMRVQPRKKKPGEHDAIELKEWTRLVRDLGELKEVRNFIVHNPTWWRVAVASDPKSGTPRRGETIFYTVQHRTDKERKPSALEEVHIDDMKAHHKAVVELTTRLRRFVLSVEERLTGLPRPKSRQRSV